MIYQLADILGSPEQKQMGVPIGWEGWLEGYALVRSVPEPERNGLIGRARDAWAVLSGRAYAIRWPMPGELELALGDPRFSGRAKPFIDGVSRGDAGRY